MSILETTKPIASSPTKEQLLENVKKKINIFSSRSFSELVKIQKEGIDLVWNNRQHTPQEIIDSLGDDAIKVFQFHGALTTLIATIAKMDGIEIELKYPTNAFTISNTGKITVTDQPYVP